MKSTDKNFSQEMDIIFCQRKERVQKNIWLTTAITVGCLLGLLLCILFPQLTPYGNQVGKLVLITVAALCVLLAPVWLHHVYLCYKERRAV